MSYSGPSNSQAYSDHYVTFVAIQYKNI